MSYTRYSVRVHGDERMTLDIDRASPESPIIADDTATPIQMGGMSPHEAAQAVNGWYESEGGQVWAHSDDIELVELGKFCEICDATGLVTIATRVVNGKRICDACLGPMTTDAYADAMKAIAGATSSDELEDAVVAYLAAIGEPEENATSESYGETADRLEASSDAHEVLNAAEDKWWELESK